MMMMMMIMIIIIIIQKPERGKNPQVPTDVGK
jgi:hypothetical protein